jgi:hypothetical protein
MKVILVINHVDLSNDTWNLIKKGISSKGDNEIWLNGPTLPNSY